MKIYTGNGDGGFTTLASGMKISKADERFEVLGCIDELVSFIGNCRAIVTCPILTKKLEDLQTKLFSIGSAITFPQKREYLPTEKDIKYIEEQIDKTENSFDREKAFILPGKCELSARLDLARSVCRRLEREIITLDKKFGVDGSIKKYINRLSDYLYILARRIDYDFEKGDISKIVGENAITPLEAEPNEKELERIYNEVIKRVTNGKEITLEKARALAQKVREKAEEIGLKAVVAIANAQGRPILVEVMDNAYLVSFDVAIKKAYTSAAVKMSTAKLCNEIKVEGSLKGLETEQSLIFLGGGEPLKVGWEVVGAIGVSGGTAEQDSKLALYASQVFKFL
ncbi:MAG: cob(I)yrinic acid a,c-diamide adenosyltransferase [Clostridia bacterium]|nr:cob(I)yrinic acid a,c-diamide adenosyltransferase [Clostridia bacterium]